MSADFPLITDLPLADQQEIARIQAIDEAKRTASESAYLDAREEYITNAVLTMKMRKGNRNPNAQAASNTITFTDDASDGEIVTIGNDVYEFDDDNDVEDGHIAVDISGGATDAEAAEALAIAIEASGTEPIAIQQSSGTIEVNAIDVGTEGNDIVTTTDCVNASWDNDTLTGGQYAVTANKGEFFLGNNDLYFATDDIHIDDFDGNWIPIQFDD